MAERGLDLIQSDEDCEDEPGRVNDMPQPHARHHETARDEPQSLIAELLTYA